jgi:hypothetical protein
MPTIQEMIGVVFSEGVPQDLRNTALVFSQETYAQMVADVQPENNKNLIQAMPLTDGRMFLCADVLTEAQDGGLFYHIIKDLTLDVLAQFSVVPMAEVEPFLPVVEGV